MKLEKDIKYRNAAEYFKAFSHPTRLLIIEKLLKNEQCVGDIKKSLGLKQANVSQHLGILRNKDIVDYTIKGKKRCYYLKVPEKVKEIFECSFKAAGKN
ncbi:MAG: ArsR/SmtB family transcription factor [Elusimicrobiota bacterium]